MTCPKCNSDHVNVQVVTETKIVEKHHGILWWLCIGWWWVFFKWLVFTLPALIIKLFRPKRYKAKTTQYSMCVCQSCGYSWKI